MRKPAVDWWTLGPWAALLVGIAAELLTSSAFPLTTFLVVPVVASAALGRPALTASMTTVSLVFALSAQTWLGYEFGDVVRRSVLIAAAGAVGLGVAALMARARRTERAALTEARTSTELLRTVTDGMLDPQILLQPVRDGSGRITDFTYADVNIAACEHLGVERAYFIGQSLVQTFPNIEESGLLDHFVRSAETGEPVALDDFLVFNGVLGTALRYDIHGSWTPQGSLSLTYRDVTDRFAAQQRLTDSEEQYRLLADNSNDIVCHIRDGAFVWVSPSIEAVLGAPAEYWLGRQIYAHIPPEDAAEQMALMAKVVGGGEVKHRGRVIGVDGVTHWFDLRARPFQNTEGKQDGVTASLRVVDEEVAAGRQIDEARRQQARADALYRRSMDTAAVGMCLADLEGNFVQVNLALCEFFGYDADILLRMTWQELTDPDYLEADLDHRAQVLAGDIEFYRMVKRFIHADGHPVWGDLAVSCLRDDAGQVELFIGQIVDITAEVLAREQLTVSEERNRLLADALQSELDTAANYVQAVLPDDLAGEVTVSSRYLPSQTLGGDCFDFFWIDHDHLVIYVLDVSGHGVESALIAVSVHNILRSNAFSPETMREPGRVLATLNNQFAMDRHDHNYFTIFYGIYERSTGMLRYANAAHPPALLVAGGQTTKLSSLSVPVGAFDDSEFACASVPIPLGSQLLVVSDGAYEIPLDDGGQWSLEEFVDSFNRLARSPDWSLDDLIDMSRQRSAIAGFTDDCCLLRAKFN